MRFLTKIALSLALLAGLLGGAAYGQSVGTPVVDGYWSTSACGTGPSPCFIQYGATLPVSATVTNPTTGAAVPATANYIAGNKGGLLAGVLIDANGAVTVAGATTAADGAALTLMQKTFAASGLYNGTTIDLYREAVNATNTTGTGVAAVGLLAQFDDTSPQTVTENQFGNLRMSSSGVLYAGGNVASAATDSGNPVKVGCKFNNSRPTFTDGQRADLQCDSVGNLPIAIYSNGNTSSVTVFAPADGTNNAGFVALATRAAMLDFNGSTWDRKFNCPNFAAISVTAANTTQIIALGSSQVIRVCSITVTTSLTGSWTMLSGTGSNCATPANSTGAMPIVTGTATTIGDGSAGVYRGSSGGELCITAVTGNITGWVMYAQY